MNTQEKPIRKELLIGRTNNIEQEKPLLEKVSLIANEISPDFIGNKSENMKEGTISPDPMLHLKDVIKAIKQLSERLKEELWERKISETNEVIDKIIKEIIGDVK